MAALTLQAQDRVEYLGYSFTDDTLPEGIATYDKDGMTPHFTAVQWGFDEGEAWRCLRETNVYPYNYFVASHSRHKKVSGQDPVAASDWLVLPSTLVRDTDAILSWRSNSICENLETTSYYSVRVSTKGNRPEDFTQEALLTVSNDPLDTWTGHSLPLSAFAGQRVWLAFVNETTNGELLAIDDISVGGGQGGYRFHTNLDAYVCGETNFTPQLTLCNLSGEPITGFTVHSRIGGEQQDITVNALIPAHDSTTVDIGPQLEVQYGDTLDCTLEVEVNEVYSDAVHSRTVFMSFEPRQHIVIEEGTGNWCGWCPKGVYAIGVLREKYGDTVLPICVHSDDPMEVAGYISDKGIYFPLGFPSGTINRKYESEPLAEVHEGRKSIFTTLHGGFETWVLKELECMPMAEIDLQVTIDGQTLSLASSTRFCVPQQGVDLRVAYILSEDHYTNPSLKQKNYLAGNENYAGVGDFAQMPSAIENFVFEDVARGAAQNAFQGIKGSLPANVEIGKAYEHKTTLTVPTAVGDIHHCSVTALLIDHATGHILNAARTQVGDGTEILPVRLTPDEPVFYDLQGRRVEHVGHGIYILNGQKVLK